MNNNIKRYSLSHQVADKLEKMIESDKYSVGDKIPTEPELMSLFEVSRNTVREAIRSLASSGILEVKQGDGTYVKFKNRFNGYMNLKCEQVSDSDIKEARDALEIAIAHLAADRRTDKDIKKIEEALLSRQQITNDIKENTKADVNFHMAIALASHNKLIYDLYQSISFFVENHISQRHVATNMDFEMIDSLHEDLFLAIKEQNADKAIECARNILKI